jgi:hypothetical protein
MGVQGAFFLKKKALGIQLSVYTHSENALSAVRTLAFIGQTGSGRVFFCEGKPVPLPENPPCYGIQKPHSIARIACRLLS